MNQALTAIRSVFRRGAGVVARWLDKLSGGRLTPNSVTIFGLFAHLPVAYLIATGEWYWAAAGLIIFGLLDTVDGELARLQGRSSVQGMLLDASTDRMKETMLYTGAAYVLATGGRPELAALAAAACGASVCVSYIKAKGEAAVASGSKQIPHAVLNKMFADGLMTFEVRMAVLAAGLVSGQLVWAVGFIAVTASLTAVQRLVRISRQLG
jgi:CDP-diacylglycerol--glycerol-3-phosphate 3-phosphatidyltransferase